MKNITEIIQEQLTLLDRGIVATPEKFEDLHAFARSNHGNSDMLLMQMSMQYGMRLALEFLLQETTEAERFNAIQAAANAERLY